MTSLRMDNIGVVVNDLKAAIAFFKELGMEVEGEATLEGNWVERVIGIDGVRSDIVLMKTPDGHGKIELTKFLHPAVINPEPAYDPVNTLGMRRIMFEVDNVDDALARLRPLGAELLGEVVQYEDQYKLCFIRGPEGILLGLAEPLR